MNYFFKLRILVDQHLQNSLSSREKASKNNNSSMMNYFQGEIDACSRMLTVINQMIQENNERSKV